MGSNFGIEPADLFRLVQMAYDVAAQRSCSLSQAIDHLALSSATTARSPGLIDLVRSTKRYRLRRNQWFETSLFRDPAWDMLLDLLLADEDGKRLSVSALCLGSGVAMTTALRHVQRLIDQGFILRHDDLLDQRRTFLTLSLRRKTELVSLLNDWHRECLMNGQDRKANETGPVSASQRPIGAIPAAQPVNPLFLS